MKSLALAVLFCASCTTRVNGFFEHEVGAVRDQDAVADLRTIADAEACVGTECDYANTDKSRGSDYGSYLTPTGRLAACIVAVASYQSPTPSQIALLLSMYEPFKRNLDDRNLDERAICTQYADRPVPAELLPLQIKYRKRSSDEAKDLLTRTLEAELPVDIAAARSARDYDSDTFGKKLAYTDVKLAWIDDLGRDPGFVAHARADLAELRYGVYGPTSMRAAFDYDPAVAPAHEELDRIERELHSHAFTTEADLARQRDLIRRSDELHTALSTEESKYSFASSSVRVKSYETAPETVRIKLRLSELKSELGDVREPERADALVAEQKQLEVQLVAVRKQFGISWSIY